MFSGLAQKNAIIELLEFYGITVNVIGMSQDTTAANVGKDKGAFGRVCKELDLCLLRIYYRRHVIELEVKHNIHHRKEYIGTRRRLVQTIP